MPDKKDKKSSKTRDWVINGVTVMVFVGIVLAGLRFFEPQTYHSLTLVLDFSQKPGDAKFEQQRISKINLLPISDEKKRILMNHTIFLDASTTMVTLAVGEPKYKEKPLMDEKGQTVDRWVYHFNGDYRPTVLQFENNVLKNAYKVSEHRLAGYPSTGEPAQTPPQTPSPATTPQTKQ